MQGVTAAELARASAVLVQTVFRLREGDVLVIVADAESDPLAQAVRRAAEATGARPAIIRLDLVRSVATNHTGERPHKVMPDVLRRSLQEAQASCYLASAPHQELSMREQMLHVVKSYGVRHVQMAGIAPGGFVKGLALGYDKVASWGRAMAKRLELARVVETDSPAGTKLRITLGEDARWFARLGEVTAGRSIALPAGALYATPAAANGMFVANASLGEFFGARAGLLLRSPTRLTIEDGRVTSVECKEDADLERDLRGMLSITPNADRVGLVAVGVNVGVDAPSGDAAIDQNLPGLHLVIGDPLPKESGASWTARSQFAACQAGGRVVIDGVVAVDAGKIVSVL